MDSSTSTSSLLLFPMASPPELYQTSDADQLASESYINSSSRSSEELSKQKSSKESRLRAQYAQLALTASLPLPPPVPPPKDFGYRQQIGYEQSDNRREAFTN